MESDSQEGGKLSENLEETSAPKPKEEQSTIAQQLLEEVRLRKFTEQVLDARQKELQSKEKESKELSRRVASLKKQLAEAQFQLSQSQEQVKTAEQQFAEARNQIFRLQPQRKVITESEAIEGFKQLCSSVQRWVENRMRGILDDLEGGRVRGRPSPAQSSRLVAFLREAAKPCIDVEQSDEYHVCAVVMHCLWLVFFAKSFYCSLDDTEDDATLTWINELSTSMSRHGKGMS